MSLLLDALKKSGQNTQSQNTQSQKASNSLSEMSLEELPSRPVTASAPPPATAQPTSPRITGENLFAAKKAPTRKKFNYTLGIVPTAIIIGLVLGTAGGIYVWIEIQPPKPMQHSNQVAAIAQNAMPAPRPAPALALPPETLAVEESQPNKARRAPVTASYTPANNIKRKPAPPPALGIQLQRKTDNDDIYSSVLAAYQAYQNGDLGTAWQRYREVLSRDAKNRDALLGLAAIAQQQEQDDVAMQYYRQVLALDPRDPVAQAGMSTFSTNDAASRESRLKQSLAHTPQSASLHYALGQLYTEQSRWGDAQQAYYNAFKIEPSNAQFSFNLATSLDHLGQTKVAAQYYRQALQLDTKGNAGFDRARTEQRLKQLTSP